MISVQPPTQLCAITIDKDIANISKELIDYITNIIYSTTSTKDVMDHPLDNNSEGAFHIDIDHYNDYAITVIGNLYETYSHSPSSDYLYNSEDITTSSYIEIEQLLIYSKKTTDEIPNNFDYDAYNDMQYKYKYAI